MTAATILDAWVRILATVHKVIKVRQNFGVKAKLQASGSGLAFCLNHANPLVSGQKARPDPKLDPESLRTSNLNKVQRG
jgi:hypothetical protein